MKINILKKILKKSNVDVAVIISTEEFKDFTLNTLTNLNLDFGIIFVFKNKKPILWVSGINEKIKSNIFEIKYINYKSNIFKDLKNCKSIALNENILSKNRACFIKKEIKKNNSNKKISFKDIGSELKIIQEIKSLEEIKKLKKAIKITQEILDDLFISIKKNKFTKEIEIQKFLKIQAIKKNVEVSFEPVVASGKNSSIPHYYPKNNSKLKKGFCVIDFGVKYQGYCSDLTRTIYLGKPSKKETLDYKKVMSGLEWCEKKIKVDVKTENLFKEFQENNFKMIHALGHGIGLNVHEEPAISLKKNKFKENQCLAIEPAIYLSGKYGIRIEDNYFVSKNKVKRLSSISRELLTFDCL